MSFKNKVVSIEDALRAANHLRQVNQFDQAILAYQNLIELQPNNPELYNLLGQVQAQSGNFEKAISNYQTAIELRGLQESFWIYKNLGDALRQKNQLDEAIDAYQKAINVEPNSADVYDSLGQAQSQKANWAEAVANYYQAIKLGLKQPFWTYSNLGNALRNQNQLNEAVAAYLEAIKLQPDNSLAYRGIGQVYTQQEDWTRAIAAFKKAIELDENQPSWVKETLSQALAKAKHPELDKFTAMTVANHQDNKLDCSAQDCLNLADKSVKEGNLKQAEHLYQAVIALQPDFTETYGKLATIQVKLHKYEEAIASYRQAIEISPNPNLYDLLATPLEKLKRWSEIVDVYCRAIELRPDYYFYYHRLGNFYHKTGDNQQAIVAYQQAIKLKPEYFWTHYHLGEAFKAEGNFKEAIKCYQNTLKIQPNLDRASNALAEVTAKQKQLEAQLSSSRKKVQITLGDRSSAKSVSTVKQGLKIAFYPRFQDKTAYTDHFYRMLWYLNPLVEQIEKITIPVNFKDIDPDVCPSYLDEKAADFYGNFTDKISFNFVDEVDDFVKEIKSANFLLCWNMEDKPSSSKDPGSDLIRTKKVWRVDHHKEQFAGSFYLKCVVDNDKQYERNLAESQEKLHDIAESLQSDIGFIFGTGPSLSQAYNFRFNNGETIACNSMLKNKTLMEYLSPRLIVAADPIFHAGCSSYAADFRKYLCDALEYFHGHLIVPMRDIHIYKHNLPAELSKRVIGIPLQKAEQPNLNLLQDFHVTSTGNVLTLYLLPLATTLFNKIGIMGCDGRPLEENNYFWKHDPSSQIVNKMSVIQEAHGAFFAIDYDDYYLTHCDTLQKWLTAAEGIGKQVCNLTSSYIPALKERTASLENNSLPSWVNVNGLQASGEPLVSIIMPARNAAETITNSIKSIQDEQLKEWEVIVINDGSMDDTVAVVEQIRQSDPRVGIYHTGGRGVSFARNVALSIARGKYIGFLDADDLFENQALTKRVQALEANPQWEGVYCRTEIVDDYLNQLGWSVGDYKRKISFSDMHGNIHLASVVGKADVLRSQSFQVGLANGEDWLYLAQVLRSGTELEYVPDCNVAYRIHERSTVLQDFVGHENKLLEVIDTLYDNDPECSAPDDKYKFGLSQVKAPDKQLIILKRRISLLTFLLLSRKARQFYQCIQETRTLPWHNLNEQTIIGGIRSTTMRYYACSQDLWTDKFQENSSYIQQVFADFKIEKIAPKFCQVVSKIYS
ncbi:MAG: tetratricopeptide repeat protein [Pleurocapsa sp.]